MPLIGVLLPTHNSARSLGQALDSILSQSYRDYRLCVVDDGSTDDTNELLTTYEDPRLSVVRHDSNYGLVTALNTGLAALRDCEYIARQDADDVSYKNRLGIQAQYLRADPTLAVVSSFSHIIDDDLQIAGTGWSQWAGRARLAWELHWSNPIIHSSVMFRHDAVAQVGGYRASAYPAEDWDLWYRIWSQGWDIETIPKFLTGYRNSVSGIRSTNNHKAFEAWIMMRSMILADLGLDDIGWKDEVRRGNLEPMTGAFSRAAKRVAARHGLSASDKLYLIRDGERKGGWPGMLSTMRGVISRCAEPES
jgi:glycosyltransferase involved in cell wall biosynthesis